MTRLVARLFTADELRDLLAAWEKAHEDEPRRSGYWSVHTCLAEAIAEAEIPDPTEPEDPRGWQPR